MFETLVDRESEAAELRALADSGRRKLALLYGRRRVGKTYLLTQLWDGERAFYFTASATSPEINRRVLLEEAGRWSGEELHPEDYPTWRAVFRALFGLHPERDLVIVLDEFQYLATGDAGLAEVASELNAVWEGRLPRTGGLLLVLSGSAVRTLAALANGGSPLYGRLDWVRQLHAFDYYDAGRMLPGYAPADRIRAYAAFGGVPKYLSSVDSARPLGQNIVDLLLRPHGEVRLQLETVLAQEEGLREYATYQGILQAVGIKRRQRGEIAAALGREADTPLRRMIAQLVELGFLEEEKNPGEPGNQAARYRIADPALRFYYGMVLPNESAIASAGAATVWTERLAAQLFPAYVGREVFEDVVRQAYLRHSRARGLPAVETWARWEGRDRDRNPVEIDLVVRLLDGRMMTGSAKFRERAADATVLLEHLDALRRLAASGRAWAREALEPGAPMLFASAAGFKPSFLEAARDLPSSLVTWTVDDLY
ncbi:MAG TPA: ATP-binding protein [Longimicrobiaceae bacterium]|nr:ATP-binding protein [Longimicrobiaceae bacterium]